MSSIPNASRHRWSSPWTEAGILSALSSWRCREYPARGRAARWTTGCRRWRSVPIRLRPLRDLRRLPKLKRTARTASSPLCRLRRWSVTAGSPSLLCAARSDRSENRSAAQQCRKAKDSCWLPTRWASGSSRIPLPADGWAPTAKSVLPRSLEWSESKARELTNHNRTAEKAAGVFGCYPCCCVPYP